MKAIQSEFIFAKSCFEQWVSFAIETHP